MSSYSPACQLVYNNTYSGAMKQFSYLDPKNQTSTATHQAFMQAENCATGETYHRAQQDVVANSAQTSAAADRNYASFSAVLNQ